MQLQGLNIVCAAAIAGFVNLSYLPTTAISADSYKHIVFDAVFFKGTIGNNLPFFTAKLANKTRAFSESSEITPQGEIFTYTVTGQVYGDSEAIAKELTLMTSLRFIIKMKDAAKRERLIGSLEYPLRFTYSFQKNEQGGQQGYTVTWTCKTPDKALFL